MVLAAAACSDGDSKRAASPASPATNDAARAVATIAPTSAPETSPSATPADSAAPATAPPQRVTFAPGEVVDARPGIYYVDPRTGVVEGWQFSDDGAPLGARPRIISPSGRYIAYGLYTGTRSFSPSPGALPTSRPEYVYRLFDTRTGTARDLGRGTIRFAPDESRYAVSDKAGITIARTADSAVERSIPLPQWGGEFGESWMIKWSHDGRFLLATVPSLAGDPPTRNVLRLDSATGMVTEVGQGLYTATGWSSDGRRYALGIEQVAEVYDTGTDRLLWRISTDEINAPVQRRDAGKRLTGLTVPLYSPDGTRAAIGARGSGNWMTEPPDSRVYVIDPESGAVHFWIEGVLGCGQLWTADSAWLRVVGMRGDIVNGSFLVRADGTEVRYLGRWGIDLSPGDAHTAGYLGLAAGVAALHVIDTPGGAVRHVIPIAGEPGWDSNHQPQWLTDGRMVVFAPHLGHGGCGFEGESPPDLTVRFPD